MKRFIIWLLQTVVLFSLGVWAPAMAAGTNQTHLSKIVKAKQMGLIAVNRRIDEILPDVMARISAYEVTLTDILQRTHQLKFLSTVSISNPFEVSMYFKQAAETFDEFERENKAVQGLANEIRSNLEDVGSMRKDLNYIAETATSKEQKEDVRSLLSNLNRFETTQLKIKKSFDEALAKYAEAEKTVKEYYGELEKGMPAVWAFYFTNPVFSVFDKEGLEVLPLVFFLWIDSIGPILDAKLPDFPVEWGQFTCAFFGFGALFLFFFRWVLARMGARSQDNQSQWIGIYRASRLTVFLSAGFWAGAMITVFPENIIFSRLSVVFGSLAAVFLAWGLRDMKLGTGLSSPLIPFFYLYAAGVITQIVNMPLRLLGILWPLGMGIMMIYLWRHSSKYRDPAPRKLARFCFWSGFPIIGLSLAGFTFPSIEVFLTLFLCLILYQFASAVSDLIRGRLVRLQEKGDSLLHSVSVSLGIPIIWFFAVGVVLLWLADQFGDSGILKMINRIRFTWQDLEFGFAQMVVAVALFFIIKPVVDVLKGGVKRLGRKSNVDEAVIMPIETVVSAGVWIIYGLILLHIVGVKLSAVVVLAGGMSVGIGFGLQHIINNFVSGLILLFGRSVRPGDVIEHQLVLGEVEKVTVRSTLVRTRNDTTMLIPNSNLVSMPFVNMSRGSRAVRLIVAVGVDYNSDTRLVERLLLEAAREHPDILKLPAPRVRFEDFKDSYLDFRIKFWVNFDGSRRIASDLRFAILKKFREHGVAIAFPQMDLHLKDVPGGYAVLKESNAKET